MSTPSSSSPIGVAILGAGIFAREAHTPALLSLLSAPTPRIRLIAVHSRTEESCRSLTALYPITSKIDIYTGEDGFKSVLARTDVHAVLVVMPISAQASIVRAALAAGKHVLSEKPVDADVTRARILVEEYQTKWASKGLIWAVAENYRFIPVFTSAAQIVASGGIGTPLIADVTFHRIMTPDNKYAKTAWRQQPEHIGGFLSDGGVHQIAAMRMIIGSDVDMKSITGNANQIDSSSFGLDTLTGSYVFTNKCHASLYITFAAPIASGACLVFNIIGTTGKLRIENAKNGVGYILTHTPYISTSDIKSVASTTTHTHYFGVDNGVLQEWESFLDSIVAGRVDPRLDAREALIDLECIERPIASSQKGHSNGNGFANDDAESRTVCVSGVSYDAEEANIRECFAGCGTIKSIRIPTFEDSGKARGIAFVEFASKEDVNKALQLDGKELMGRYLKIILALPKPSTTSHHH